MPRLFNVGSEPVVISWSERAVMPGGSYVFTDEQVAAGVAGQWSEENPRTVKSRPKREAPAEAEQTEPPAEPEKES